MRCFLFQVYAHVCCNGVSQTTWLVNAGQGGKHFRRHFFAQIDVFLKLADGRAKQALNLTFGNIITDNLAHAGYGKVTLVIYVHRPQRESRLQPAL